jgi:hypothetical protein
MLPGRTKTPPPARKCVCGEGLDSASGGESGVKAEAEKDQRLRKLLIIHISYTEAGRRSCAALTTKEVAMFGRKEPSAEEIARRAHELYLQRGGEHGKDVEDWVRAEKELSDERVAIPAKTRTAQAIRNMPN